MATSPSSRERVPTMGASSVQRSSTEQHDGRLPGVSVNGTFRNRLLAALSADERTLLEPQLEHVTLDRRALLYDPERPIQHVYFLENGIASILSVMLDGGGIETGTIGPEGMIGLPVFHGMDRVAEQAMMQVGGTGHRVPAERFQELAPKLPTLSALLHRFSVYMFTFAAQNSGCNRKHSVDERCAKWLLTVHDRMETDRFELTHDFISQMLGVRRASVTVALGGFERAGLIRATRSQITVANRTGLEGVACECYGVVRAALERALGRPTLSILSELPLSRDGHSTLGDGTPDL
jgi:CRP-like cAMP-binding protein